MVAATTMARFGSSRGIFVLSREQLDRYFDGRAKPVQAAQSTLKVLATTDVSFDLPGLAETLTALRNLKFARERGAGAAR